jgi:hypothetical protein
MNQHAKLKYEDHARSCQARMAPRATTDVAGASSRAGSNGQGPHGAAQCGTAVAPFSTGSPLMRHTAVLEDANGRRDVLTPNVDNGVVR